MARLLILLGLLLLVAGVVLALFPRAFSWFGRLPGDIDIERGSIRVFIPLGSMVLVSLLLTGLLNLAGWLLERFR